MQSTCSVQYEESCMYICTVTDCESEKQSLRIVLYQVYSMYRVETGTNCPLLHYYRVYVCMYRV